ncbi:MAG: glycosyl transferase family 1 [Ectothiorhodospiraceae bacterium]|nr:glycosyl transferase family 1 [Ectothiorhodospiraceae bacterium]
MKIVLIGTAYPLRGGIAHYVGLLYKYLSRDHDVSVVTFSLQYPKLLFPGKSQEESGDAGVKLQSYQWINTVNPLSWIAAGLKIRKLNADLIIYKFWMPFFAPSYGVTSMIARLGRKTKSVFIDDNVIPHEKRPGDKLLTKFAFSYVDGHIVQSKAVERDLKLWHRDPVYTELPHPVYEIFGEEQSRESARVTLRDKKGIDISDEDHVLLFFGYVRDYKGLDVLLDAMPHILAKRQVKLLVVGEFYGNEETYRDQVARLGIAEHVHFHAEYVPNEEVGLYFSAADVMTLPYKSATQSGIIQIAYNFHRPVIATDVGGLGEVVIHERTGYIVPPQDPENLASAVERFYAESNFELYRANVIEERKKYSWEYFCEGIEKLYHRLNEAKA